MVLDLLDSLRGDHGDRVSDLLTDLLKFCNDLSQVNIFVRFLEWDVITEHGAQRVENHRQVRHLLGLIAGLLFHDRKLKDI